MPEAALDLGQIYSQCSESGTFSRKLGCGQIKQQGNVGGTIAFILFIRVPFEKKLNIDI